MLIIRQEENLTEIGLKAGYFDQAHFIHDFKDFSGLSPSEYREQNAQLIWDKVDSKNTETLKIMKN